MLNYNLLNKEDLKNIYEDVKNMYNKYSLLSLNIDMSRGKPCNEQLELSRKLMNCLEEDQYLSANGIDCRNYGIVDGIQEAKKLFADMLEVDEKEIILGGNSSLNMMYDVISGFILKGVPGINIPWHSYEKVKFLCPSPGYDRHFAICEYLGIEMITIDMKADGPDMNQVEALVSSDDTIKGIWCVPKYSNPEGITYSDEVVHRLASMRTKANDFRIFWDNAYIVHHLSDTHDTLKNILRACEDAGNAHRVFMFSSTSKITFPGSGIAMMGSSESNINEIKTRLSIQTIGPDKINELRHVKFLKDMNTINEHMKEHAKILNPKFQMVLDTLEENLSGKDIAWWSKPNGGYFISFNTMDGCASKVVDKAAQLGVKLTKAGATFPYFKDPRNRNIRLAPSFPQINELKMAIEILCTCVELITLEHLLDM